MILNERILGLGCMTDYKDISWQRFNTAGSGIAGSYNKGCDENA